jgi:hypothetical protein
MLVFSYAIEVDALDGSTSADFTRLAKEAVAAYRKRADLLQAKGDADAAARDLKRAEKLEAKLKPPDKADAADATRPKDVTVRNDWKEALTVVVNGAAYTLQVGESKSIPSPAASFPYELQVGPNRSRGTMEAGRSYRIGE